MRQIKENKAKGHRNNQSEVIELVPQVHVARRQTNSPLPGNCVIVPMLILDRPEPIRRGKRRKTIG
jgi:hypothetical protein